MQFQSAIHMPDYDILSILQRISHAFPEKPLDEFTLKVYVDELADIPVMLLERAARQHIRTSSFFPRISELRQVADQIARLIFDSPASLLERVISPWKRIYLKPITLSMLILISISGKNWLNC